MVSRKEDLPDEAIHEEGQLIHPEPAPEPETGAQVDGAYGAQVQEYRAAQVARWRDLVD